MDRDFSFAREPADAFHDVIPRTVNALDQRTDAHRTVDVQFVPYTPGHKADVGNLIVVHVTWRNVRVLPQSADKIMDVNSKKYLHLSTFSDNNPPETNNLSIVIIRRKK